jgi:hypothetical protein
MGVRRTITLNQEQPLPIVATAWSKAQDVSGQPDKDYSLYLDILYADGDHLWGQSTPFASGTHDWQQVTVQVSPTKPVRSVSVYLLFRGNHYGTVWFDDISLRQEGDDRELATGGGFDAFSAQTVTIDGLYLDSFEMAATMKNYRREHFASADIPLVFDGGGQVCQLGHFLAMELAMHVADIMHERGRLVFANAVLHNFPWPAACLDVFGTETNWNRGGKFAPDSDEGMLYWRAMCYQRPYLTLQNTVFEDFPSDLVERYFARCCYYGVLPSFFSHDAATRVYWNRPEIYNRDRYLFRKYIPVIRRIAEAGWQPITWADSSNRAVWVERFGNEQEAFFTVFNASEQPQKALITVEVGKVLAGNTHHAELLLPEKSDLGEVRGPKWQWEAELQPDQVVVIHLGG